MMRLADTTLRLYRKGDGRVSVRWRSFFMLHVKGAGFRLSAYLNKLEMSATFPDGQVVLLDDWGYSDACDLEMDHMIHMAWAAGTADMPVIRDSAAILRVEYRLFSYEGQGAPSVIEVIAPVVACGPYSLRYPPRTSR